MRTGGIAVKSSVKYSKNRKKYSKKQWKYSGETLAADILDNGLKLPIHVRRDKERYVLVEGLHRLEALKALGEATIDSLIVMPRRS